MNIDFLRRLATFVALLLVQGMVFNHIHLFGIATPMVAIIFVLHFRRNYPRWAILLWSFLLGLGIDVFANTPGVASASMTLLGAIQPTLFGLFVPRDSAEDLKPSIRNIGMSSYLWYVFAMVVVYCLTFFSLEAFNFFNWVQWLKNIGGSIAITLVLIFALENLRKT